LFSGGGDKEGDIKGIEDRKQEGRRKRRRKRKRMGGM
jgi:hypothetical protein